MKASRAGSGVTATAVRRPRRIQTTNGTEHLKAEGITAVNGTKDIKPAITADLIREKCVYHFLYDYKQPYAGEPPRNRVGEYFRTGLVGIEINERKKEITIAFPGTVLDRLKKEAVQFVETQVAPGYKVIPTWSNVQVPRVIKQSRGSTGSDDQSGFNDSARLALFERISTYD